MFPCKIGIIGVGGVQHDVGWPVLRGIFMATD